MLQYIIKRILMMIPVLLGVSVIVFALQVFTPGDPADVVLGATASDEQRAEWKAKYDLDKPIYYQYVKYMKGLITKGDFGISYRTGTSLNSEIAHRWPISLKLAICSVVIGCLIGIPLGILSAQHRGKLLDAIARILGILGISIPMFWLAYLLIMLFAINLKLLPVSGLYSFKHWILPAFTMGILSSASILRVVRSAVLDSISQDFVRTARSKGQKESVITRHHILRNSLIPIINSVGTEFATNLGGSAVIETVFVITGMGVLMVSAINNRDYAQLRACVILVALAVSIVNLFIDLAYAFIDPRIKAQFKSTKRMKKKTAAIMDKDETDE